MEMCWCCSHDEVWENEKYGGIGGVALGGTILLKARMLDQMPSTHTIDNNAINNDIKKLV
jgi:hypothetical protein